MRFLFLIVDVPASYKRNLLRNCQLDGNLSCFILSSDLRMIGDDPILMPDPESQVRVARSTPSLIPAARPSRHSTRPPMLPTS